LHYNCANITILYLISIQKEFFSRPYLVPRSKGISHYLTEIIEFVAGRDHYRNFKAYISNGGINYLATKAGLKIIYEIKNQQTANHVVVLTR